MRLRCALRCDRAMHDTAVRSDQSRLLLLPNRNWRSGNHLQPDPYSQLVVSTTIDGASANLCTLRRTTCAGLTDVTSQSCDADADCGETGQDDGRCDTVIETCSVPCTGKCGLLRSGRQQLPRRQLPVAASEAVSSKLRPSELSLALYRWSVLAAGDISVRVGQLHNPTPTRGFSRAWPRHAATVLRQRQPYAAVA
jgi:hypothetical protein